MRRILSLLSVLILTLLICTQGRASAASTDKTVGIDIAFEDITDFYYTYDASTAPPLYQRYRFYAEEGKHYFYHETREGGGWPQTEADITRSGTVELTEKQWTAFCDFLNGGKASMREEHLESGDAGPWLYIYWRGGETEGREFSFDQPGTVLAFEKYCAGLKEESNLPASFVGPTEVLVSGDTLQLKDYSKTDWPWYFNPEEKYRRHETVFPQEMKKARQMGAALLSRGV